MSGGSNDNQSQGSSPATGPKLSPGDQAAPGTPGTGENVCPECKGSGQRDAAPCPNCSGTGKVVEGVGGA